MSSTARKTTPAATIVCVALAALSLPPIAFAQRTDENVTAQSDDAFGRSVGNESLGIYTSDEVRGFSPIDAGNARIEGLYFDRQTSPPNRLIEGSTIRVGIASQSYPFPSPTGIVDYDLRRVGAEAVVSPVLYYGPFDTLALEVDTQMPIAGERFGIAAGAEIYRSGFQFGTTNNSHAFAVIPRWAPTPDIELRPFYSSFSFSSEEPQPLMLTAGSSLPPRIERDHYFGQPWAQGDGRTDTYGFLGNVRHGDWAFRLGVFESVYAPSIYFADLYSEIDPSSRRANELVVALPDSRYSSKSGEFRVARTFEESNRRHTVFFAVRARQQQRRYGGDDLIDVGAVTLGVPHSIDAPRFEFGEQSHDEVRQRTGGISYELRWKGVGEMSVGVQKTWYRKSSDTPLGELPESRADPLLKNATATYYATQRLAIYGSYAQGLEESPVAPNNATNRNAAAPAILTKQYDAGVRYTIAKNVNLIAGIFNVEKPYFDLDTNGVFRELGDVRHRGLELSVAGSPITNLTVIAGMRILDARVSGPLVDAGIVGRTPVSVYRTHGIGSINYVLGHSGFSIDAAFESVSRQMADTQNTVSVPGRAVLHIGGRYKFTMFGKPTTVRALASNIFDRYGWTVMGGGAYVYNAPRRYSVYVATDL